MSDHLKQISRETKTRRADWVELVCPQTRVGVDYAYRNKLTGMEVFVNDDQGEVTFKYPDADDDKPSPRWNDNFVPADRVGNSEYRALVELLADANDIGHVAGEDIADDAVILEDHRDHMVGMLDEVISYAKAMKRTLGRLQY